MEERAHPARQPGGQPEHAEAGAGGGAGGTRPGFGFTGHGGAAGSYGYGFSLNSGAGGGGAAGAGEGDGSLAVVMFEDAKYVSASATAFLVWMRRLLSVIDSLREEWHAATRACKQAEMRIDSARNQVETLRSKLLVAEREEAAREADLREQQAQKVELRRLTSHLPTELTTNDLLIIPHRGQVRVCRMRMPGACPTHTRRIPFC